MAPGAAVVRDGADDHLPARFRGESAWHVYSDRGGHVILARRWWIMLLAGLRAGVPPATRAALLVHLVHGCVLSGTLAPPV